ncbi:serine/threonine-protein kinase [Sandaracinus amylolyticus]|uniref:Serine/threonine protein kinase n=1 Tax=Sandaracinus amylolyticus TaxID=927083 RepID=A0A0F6W9N3_9BACT|nr:serine/threonine-protein kinase [Sandaracinus amylolyticus]AKF10993.1 serine/threonine protein kinase [Sandaracinus amylolyticus]
MTSSSGKRLGPYVLGPSIASGGMATVHVAHGGPPLDRVVAIKRIHPHLAREKAFVEMFLDEARIAARVQHPNVCPVLDYGEEGGAPYLVMELVRGETVEAIVGAIARAYPDDPIAHARRVLRVAVDACEGLHAAHELGVVHRDVSARNLFVGDDGCARVLDFGVARAREKTHRTATGVVKGTFATMSPEHVEGREIDRRADVWSIAVLAWELLTGERLFARDREVDTLRALSAGVVRPPSMARPGVPRAVDAPILAALTRDREKRTPTARALGLALHDAARAFGGLAHASEIAAWMAQTFPAHGEARRAIVGASTSAPIELERVTAPAAVPVPAAPVIASDERVSPPAPPPALPDHLSVPPPITAPAAHRGPRPLVYALSVVVTIVVAATGGWLAARASSPAPLASVAEPSTPIPVDALEPTPIPAVEPEPDLVAPPEPEPEPAAETAPAVEPDPVRRERGRGFANVSVRGGWADIYHRGRYLGRTPTRVELPAGRQTLELAPFGRAPRRRVALRVPAGGDATASIALE